MTLFVLTSQRFLYDLITDKVGSAPLFSTFEDLEENVMSLNEELIVLFDIASFENVSDALKSLQRLPLVKVFALTPQLSLNEGLSLLPFGIKGYGHSLMSKNLFLQAITQIGQNMTWFDPRFFNELISSLTLKEEHKQTQREAINKLTIQEKKVAHYVSQGLLNKEIAGKLAITERTAKAHLQSCYRKLGINDRVSLAMLLKDEI
jgi:DNA-binding NarL/FixJ family response regulator